MRSFLRTITFGTLVCGLLGVGCTPAVIGGGAAGGYAVVTDERSAGRQVDDATITTKITAEMVQDDTVKARDVDVNTVSGTVYLVGLVDSAKERERAEAIARSVAGVRGVVNQLELGSRSVGQALDDKNLGVKIKAKLISEPGIRSLNVDVDVYRGVVFLTGMVENGSQKEKVVDLARSTPGTARIVDNLRAHGR